MSGMDNREKAFENKFAHDQEMKFKAEARRNKLLGLWAAAEMGISGDEANAYAVEVVRADFEEAGHEDVVRKIRKDFDEAGVAHSDQVIRERMIELLAEASRQIEAE